MNNIIRRFNGTAVILTVEETFSDSTYPDNHFCYVLRGNHSDGSESVVGYYDKDIAISDFRLLVSKELGELPLDR